MSKKITVRPATAMDSVNIVRLLKSQYAEAPAHHVATFDEQQILSYVANVMGTDLRTGARSYVIVAEREGRLLGSLALTPIVVPWNPTQNAMVESWFAVQPKYLEQGVDDMLLTRAEEMLDRIKLPAMFGSNLFSSAAMSKSIAKRHTMSIGRTTYVRPLVEL